MECEKAYRNWNYMYEYKLLDKWCPCHILNDLPVSILKKGFCHLYNAYGSADTVPSSSIRKMSKADYLKHRSKCVEWLGNALSVRLGFHENEADDLKMWKQSNDLEAYRGN